MDRVAVVIVGVAALLALALAAALGGWSAMLVVAVLLVVGGSVAAVVVSWARSRPGPYSPEQATPEQEAERAEIREFEKDREMERRWRTFLEKDALRTPGSALLWWLAQHRDAAKDQLERAAELFPTFGELSRMAKNEPPPAGPYPDNQTSMAAGGSPTMLTVSRDTLLWSVACQSYPSEDLHAERLLLLDQLWDTCELAGVGRNGGSSNERGDVDGPAEATL